MAGLGMAMVHNKASIKTYQSRRNLVDYGLRGAHLTGTGSSTRLIIDDATLFRMALPTLAANVADFGKNSAPEDVQAMSAWIIREGAQQLGAKLNSPNEVYKAIADGIITRKMSFAAVNVRGNSLDTARALFRAAKDNNVGALIVEIARSEMGYTAQAPREFAAVIQAAAVMENFVGPIFLQGDHIQLKSAPIKEGGEAAAAERASHSAVIKAMMENGFGSIDLDMSPFELRGREDLSHEEQQAMNARLTAEKVAEIRTLERRLGIQWTTLLGGETGEVGKMNTSEADLVAYGELLTQQLLIQALRSGSIMSNVAGIRKIAVNDGTSHGGVPLPDGSVADVSIAFDVLRMATDTGKRFGWAGSVQHGASTLPDNAFSLFPENGAVEVHLATGFQNIQFDVGFSQIPTLQQAMHAYLDQAAASERKPGMTDEQFYYKARKKAFGPFKLAIWTMPMQVRAAMAEALYEKFVFLFQQLGIVDTQALIAEHVTDHDFHRPFPTEGAIAAQLDTDDDGSLAD